MLFIIVVLLLMDAVKGIEESKGTLSTFKSHKKKPFAAVVFSSTNNLQPLDKQTCHWLSRLKHQSKTCYNKKGLPEALLEARLLSIAHCNEQFKFDQWNCSNREFFFRKVYQETAFMYSIASSAVMYQIAKACSEGTLSGCKCGSIGKPNNSSWIAGCSDNSKFAKQFTKRFLQLKKKKKGDQLDAMIRYNSEVGIRAVLDNEQLICKCHGPSGACTLQICFKKIRSFHFISKQLKNFYYKAMQVNPGNNVHSYKFKKGQRKLLYLDRSPNFCPMTVNRHCTSRENCSTLCCNRGYYKDNLVKIQQCNCSWREDQVFAVKCNKCKINQTILRCK